MRRGFTLLEVLLAAVIFAVTVLAVTQSISVAVNNVTSGENLFYAVELAQAKMVEMEIKYQKEIDKFGVEAAFAEENGAFEAPFEQYSWSINLKETSIQIKNEVLLKLMTELGLEKEEAEKQLEQQALVLTNLNKLLKENSAELVLQVKWKEFGKDKALPLVTHLIPKKPKVELTTTIEDGDG